MTALAGCGGSGSGEPASVAARAPNEAQLARAAQALLLNHQDGGARVTGKIPLPEGGELSVDGAVDWARTRGRVRFAAPDGTTREYRWTARAVLAERPDGRWTASQPGPMTHPVHAAIRLVSSLAAETVDNTAVLRDRGIRLLRLDDVDGTPVEVYRIPDGQIDYWISPSDGHLLRIDADMVALGGTATIVFSDPGPQRVPIPDRSRWIRQRR